MNDVVSINGNDLSIKMWNGQRVVTLADIDKVHERPEGTAKKNFQNNKKHFLLDVDYFQVTRKELREKFSPNSEPLKGNPNIQSYLFTESGYLLLVKSFTDDLAWSVQRQLVNSYFKLNEIVQDFNSNYPIDIVGLNDFISELKDNLPCVYAQINSIENSINEVVDNMTLNVRQQEIIHETARKRINYLLGGAHSTEYKRNARMYMINLWNGLKANFHCGSSYKDLNPKDFNKAISYIENWVYEK